MQLNAVVKKFSDLTEVDVRSWKTFQASNPSTSNPFFTYGYAECVNDVRSGVEVLCVYSATDEPVGYLPFRKSITGFARPVDGLISDLHGFVCDQATTVDLMALLKKGGVAGYAFTAMPYDHLGASDTAEVDNIVIDLSGGYESYISDRRAKSPGFRERYDAAQKLLNNHQIEILHDDYSEDVFDHLIQIKRDGFQEFGHYDIFHDEWTLQLLHRLTETSAEDVRGCFSYMRIDGELAAYAYSMMTQTTLHFWFTAHETKFDHVIASDLLTFSVLEWAAKFGIHEVQFGTTKMDRDVVMASRMVSAQQGVIAANPIHKMADRFSRWSLKNEDGGWKRFPAKFIRRYERAALTGAL